MRRLIASREEIGPFPCDIAVLVTAFPHWYNGLRDGRRKDSCFNSPNRAHNRVIQSVCKTQNEVCVEMRVAVIDDNYRAFAGKDAVRRLQDVAEVTIYEKPFPSQDALVEVLRGVEAVIAYRGRTQFTAELLALLPDLRYISNTGNHCIMWTQTPRRANESFLLTHLLTQHQPLRSSQFASS